MTDNNCKICGKPAQSKRSKYCSAECFRQSERNYANEHRRNFSPERKRAGSAVAVAISSGKLKPMPCEVCARESNVHAHHDDYAAPLAVRWLCRSHHKRHHREHGPGKNSYSTLHFQPEPSTGSKHG